ncbi:MAG: M15 family metallopeptidase [Chitinophagales bacterium]
MLFVFAISLTIIYTFYSASTNDHSADVTPPVTFNFQLVTADFLQGRYNYYTDSNFIEIPASQCYRTKMYLLKDTYTAFHRMYLAASKEGIPLKIISATRTFDEQKNVWEDKWKKNALQFSDPLLRASAILQYSAMPGTSRHHWGTEIDLNSLSDAYFESAAGRKVYSWLQQNAPSYGFCQTYNQYNQRNAGYQEEKWHWSYYPISNILLTLYQQKVNHQIMSGFSGAETAGELDILHKYMLSVNQDCMH